MTAVEKMHFVAPAVSTLGLAPCVQGAPDSYTHTHGGVDPRNEQVPVVLVSMDARYIGMVTVHFCKIA